MLNGQHLIESLVYNRKLRVHISFQFVYSLVLLVKPFIYTFVIGIYPIVLLVKPVCNSGNIPLSN